MAATSGYFSEALREWRKVQNVEKTVDNILVGTIKSIPQCEVSADTTLRPAPKIFKDTCRIDRQKGTKKNYDFIRGLSPYPAACTELQNGDKTQVLKIFESEKIEERSELPVGSVVIEDKKLLVSLADGMLSLKVVQIAGKKRMKVEEFLNGFHANGEMKVK